MVRLNLVGSFNSFSYLYVCCVETREGQDRQLQMTFTLVTKKGHKQQVGGGGRGREREREGGRERERERGRERERERERERVGRRFKQIIS